MKVLYIHQHFRTSSEAGGTRSWEFARRMASDGMSVTVLCGGESASNTVIDGVKIIRLRVPYANSMGIPRRLLAFLRFIVAATAVGLRHRCDVVFASSTPLTVAVPGMLVSMVRRSPLVFEVRDLWPDTPRDLGLLKSRVLYSVAKVLEILVYRYSEAIVALSPGMAKGVERYVPRERIRVIPNACDFSLFSAPADVDRRGDASELRVVYAGSFGKIYDIPWLVKLAAATRGEGVSFRIFGDGTARQEVSRLCREMGIEEDVLAPGLISKDQVASEFARADVVISSLIDDPALDDSSLNKVFDAMAAGKAIVLNHGGWLSDLCVESGAGIRLSRDVSVASRQLLDWSLEIGAVQSAGAAAREVGRAQFDREALYRVLKETLEAVCGRANLE